ncbi:hypothetical protein [Brevundimonas sp.]|uniref:hypothetical protein n=1 Tax=Brevundimonas sp. TaxID=1871086 RepID=UPI0035B0BD1E
MTHDDPHSRATDPVHQGQPVEAQYVRGGRKGNRILILLVVSVALAAAVLLGFWALTQGEIAETDNTPAGQAQVAAEFEGDAMSPPSADAPTTAEGQPTNPPTGEAPNVNAPVETPPAA